MKILLQADFLTPHTETTLRHTFRNWVVFRAYEPPVTNETGQAVLALPPAKIMHDGNGNGRLVRRTKQFGFVALSNGYGSALLHMSALKEAG